MRDTVAKPLTRDEVLARCRKLTARLVEQWCAPSFDRTEVAMLNQEIEGLLHSIGLALDDRARERTDIQRLMASEKMRIIRKQRHWSTRRGLRNGKAT